MQCMLLRTNVEGIPERDKLSMHKCRMERLHLGMMQRFSVTAGSGVAEIYRPNLHMYSIANSHMRLDGSGYF